MNDSKKVTRTTVIGSQALEDLFDIMKELKDMYKVELRLTSGDNERYALKWIDGSKELTVEDNDLHTLVGFVIGYINGRMSHEN